MSWVCRLGRIGYMQTDEELMLAYQRGEQAAFRLLFDRYNPLLQRIMRRGMFRANDIDDLVQQTFLQLHRARKDFETGRTLRPWILTIAMNLKRQYFRKESRTPHAQVEIAPGDEPLGPGGDPMAAVAASQLREALQTLPQTQRDAIVLHWFEGLSFPEISEILGVRESALKVRAHRGYAKLRTILDEDVTVSANGS